MAHSDFMAGLFVLLHCVISMVLAQKHFVAFDGSDRNSRGVSPVMTDSDFPEPQPLPDKKGWWSSLGNHRFALNVTGVSIGDTVTATLIWRRIDSQPLHKDIIITSATSHNSTPVQSCVVDARSDSDKGIVSFSADAGSGLYYLYYLSFLTCEFSGGTCPYGGGETQIVYNPLSHCKLGSVSEPPAAAADGDVTASYQARTQFDSLVPMQVPQTAEEANKFVSTVAHEQHTDMALLVTELPSRHVSMTGQLPFVWLEREADALMSLVDTVRPGENYTFQVAVVALNASVVVLDTQTVTESDGLIDLRCMSLYGSDFWGRPARYNVTVPALRVKPLWFAVEVDSQAKENTVLRAQININLQSEKEKGSGGGETRTIDVALTVSGAPVPHGGDDDMDLGSRLQWLDSRIGLGSSAVPAPYTALKVTQGGCSGCAIAVNMLGKVLQVGTDGMLFSALVLPNPDDPLSTSVQVLAQPVQLLLYHNGSLLPPLPSSNWDFNVTYLDDVSVHWTSQGVYGEVQHHLQIRVDGQVDVTGFVDMNITLGAVTNNSGDSDTDVWLSTELVVVPSASFLFGMGLGVHGGLLEKMMPKAEPIHWQWSGVNGDNSAWVGSSQGGVRTSLKGADPLWQAGVPFDSKSAPAAPASWHNGGEGGAVLFRNGTFMAYTGTQKIPSTSTGGLSLLFSHVITPVRPLNLSKHWSERWVQIGYTAENSNWTFFAQQRATVVNIHQGNALNPWINYPYLTNALLKQATQACHDRGMRLSVYNTMRELSNRCRELFPMLFFGETYVPSTGLGADWLQEHIMDGEFSYSPAWSTPMANFTQDAAIRDVALSRWNNYYVHGVQQMMRDFNLDGLYLDEIAYDRVTLLRARTQLGARGLVDHHSDSGAFCNSPANNYMELFPFIDRLWYGEGFPYDTATADYWLVEMSGLTMGLTADMLRYTGTTPYHFRGFVHAESNRWQSGLAPGQENDPYTPIGLWALWDQFGIAESVMYGWWIGLERGSGAVPVNLAANSNSSILDTVKVTSYVQHGDKTLVCVASFTQDEVQVQLDINFAMLGLSSDPSSTSMSAPSILPFQSTGEANLPFDHTFTISKGQGVVLLISAAKVSQ